MNIGNFYAVARRHPWRTALVVVLLVVVVFFIVKSVGKNDTTESVTPLSPLVSLTTSAKYENVDTLSLIGTVRALSEAEVTAERGGRVVSVGTTLGANVNAGAIIATLENASERAAVLQAEGAYEAALAAAAQSGISVNEARNGLSSAKNNTRATILSSYNTVNNIILNSVDDFFANPQSNFPGLRIDGKGYTSSLNAERIAYQTLLSDWRSRTQNLDAEDNLTTEIDYALTVTNRTINFVETFITVFSVQSNSSQYTDEDLSAFRSTFANLKATLIATQTSLNNSETSLKAANDVLLRAETATVGGSASSADAQVKQALGVLRNAQANLAKTILRTPISGTVNSLSVKPGDYINGSSKVAVVANNQALEIITYVGDQERSLVNVDDTVTLDELGTGVVRQISPALDPVTRKFEVRIVSESSEVKNGDTVKISTKDAKVKPTVTVRVPITAIKFEIDNGYVFKVEANKLVKVPVTLGAISGSSVEIKDGLTADEEFVVDVRGLQAGDEVTVR